MTITINTTDRDLIARLVATEADHSLRRSHPDVYAQQVRGIVDTVLNRVASEQFPNDTRGVANQKRQFSKITGPSRLDPYGKIGNAPKAPDFVSEIVNGHIDARMGGERSSVGGSLHYANPHFSDAKNRKWIDKLDEAVLGKGKRIHRHGTTDGFKPVEATFAPRPSTALAAIKELAGPPPERPSRLSYAKEPEVGEPVDNIELPRKRPPQIGEAFPFNFPTDMGPERPILKTALAEKADQMRTDGYTPNVPEAPLRLTPEPPDTQPVVPPAPTRPSELFTRNFDQAEQGFDTAVEAPTIADDPDAPVPVQAPAGLQDRKFGVFEKLNEAVRQAVPQYFNARHDVGGQIDGLKISVRDRLEEVTQRALGRRPHNTTSLSAAQQGGNIIGGNGYIYSGPRGERRQTGKVVNGEARMWTDNKEKPKGYRYYDPVTKEWKEK